MLQPAVLAEHDVGSYYAIRPDDCSGTDFRARINNRRRMNLHVAHSPKPLTLIRSPWRKGSGEKLVAALPLVAALGALAANHRTNP